MLNTLAAVAQTLGMSQEFSFRTAPLLGPSGTAKILAIADHGERKIYMVSCCGNASCHDGSANMRIPAVHAGHAQVDGSTAYEQTQSLTTDALTIPNPEDTAATNTADELVRGSPCPGLAKALQLHGETPDHHES